MVDNTEFSDAVRQLYVPRLNSISVRSDYGVRGLLECSENFTVLPSTQKNCFTISFYNMDDFLGALASDIVRLSSASFETVEGLTTSAKNKKFLAWQMVQYYYAAFYAAHSILKICSFGLVQLDNRILQKVKHSANAFSIPFGSMESGMYCMKIEGASVTFFKVQKYDDSHRGLWARYSDFLGVLTGINTLTDELNSKCVKLREEGDSKSLSVYNQLSISDAETIVVRLDLLRKTLTTNGDNNWLSSIRNQINYNHCFGVWYPYKGYLDSYEKLVSLKDLYREPFMSSRLEYKHESNLIEFVKCCENVISMDRELLLDLSKRHPDNKSFLRRGPLELINLSR